MPPLNVSSIFIAPCTSNEIITVVNCLSNSIGIGLDGFMIKVIKLAIRFIAEPLLHIFNRSFEVGTFPSHLKYAKVIPVFKTDNKLLISNYQPISILPVLSKALEKNNALSTNDILCKQM